MRGLTLPPRMGVCCHPGTGTGVFHSEPARIPPHALFTAHSHERASTSRACTSPPVRSSSPRCLRSMNLPLPVARQTQQQPSPCHCPETQTGQPKPSVTPQPRTTGDATSTLFHLRALPIPPLQDNCSTPRGASSPMCTGSCIHGHQPSNPEDQYQMYQRNYRSEALSLVHPSIHPAWKRLPQSHE